MPNGSWNPPQVKLKEFKFPWRIAWRNKFKGLKIKGDLGEQETVRVKMSGDGTNIGKRLKVVNFTYTILNEKENAMSEKGNYVLAIIKTKETYDNLKESLERKSFRY